MTILQIRKIQLYNVLSWVVGKLGLSILFQLTIIVSTWCIEYKQYYVCNAVVMKSYII